MAVTVDTRDVAEFVRCWLPQSPATVLEVGAGSGALARRLIDAGYDVTPIDPIATGDDLVRAISLEEFDDIERYDAVVASRTLHHIHDLDVAVAKIHGHVADGGYIVLDGFGWDRLDEPTGRWLYSQLEERGQVSEGRESFNEWIEHWRSEHADLHRSTEMLEALRDRFDERYFAACPYLAAEYLEGGPQIERTELDLIRDAAIRAAGFRFVGQPDRGS